MEYWVSINNNQVGPMSLEEVVALNPSADMLVWHPGMPDWDKAVNLPELAHLFESQPENVEESQEDNVDTQEENIVADKEETIEQPIETFTPEIKEENQAIQSVVEPKEPCPPTYLVWTILVTVLCCVPLGVISLIYSSQVKSKYEAGDIEGAKKASTKTELWLILAFVLGLIYQPFSVVFALL